jgi:hypothetical protein
MTVAFTAQSVSAGDDGEAAATVAGGGVVTNAPIARVPKTARLVRVMAFTSCTETIGSRGRVPKTPGAAPIGCDSQERKELRATI